ncbi:MAG: hypothetical protein MUP22_00890 [Desulfobacterales bacterium]|nr:hypothetical protein [Desulfobacterales bacterium]
MATSQYEFGDTYWIEINLPTIPKIPKTEAIIQTGVLGAFNLISPPPRFDVSVPQ